jgi:hypothetical protein
VPRHAIANGFAIGHIPKGNQKLFGGVSIIFLGDFHQLQPVGAKKN